MKTRILAAAVLVPALFVVILALPKIFTALLFGVMCAMSAYELMYATGLVRHPRLQIYAMVSAFLVALWSYCGAPYAVGLLWVLIFVGILFGEMFLSLTKLRFDKLCVTIAAGLLIPFLLCSLIRIFMAEGRGRYLIMIPFVIAFLSDTFAYFVGCAIGKHKLAPVISPKKSVEGLVGGVLGAMAGMLLYGMILNLAFDFTVNYGYILVYGFVGSLAGVFGDLCFSAIKRQTGIKDYANLIPGHGGILDRFDSMILVGPLTEVLLILLPAVM